jgi:hypothetical protein
MKQKATLSLDSKLYKDFQQYCDEKGLILSRQIEFIIKDILEKEKGGKHKS